MFQVGDDGPGADKTLPAFEVLTPSVVTVPLVFNSPHSGAVYPPAFLAASRLDPMTLRKSEDCFVDALFGAATDFGAPLLRAHFPRAFLDVNREPYELDPRMFDGRLPSFINARSMRVAGGLGRSPALSAISRKSTPANCRFQRRLRGSMGSISPTTGLCVSCCRISTAGSAWPSSSIVIPCRRPEPIAKRASGLISCWATGLAQAPPPSSSSRLRKPCGAAVTAWAQSPLCRRLHHRALWQPGSIGSRHPNRGQSRPLYG